MRRNKRVTRRPLTMCAGAWLGYVGYPVEKMLTPAAEAWGTVLSGGQIGGYDAYTNAPVELAQADGMNLI